MLAGTQKTVLEKVQVLIQNPFSIVANENMHTTKTIGAQYLCGV